jgi:hypothetical protein
MIATTLAAIAIVALDQSPLKAAPKDSATQQAVLWQGDALEIRGQRLDYLQVYDHRRERAGYVHVSQVRVVSTEPESADQLRAVIRFVRDTPGAEALGMSYTAAYIKAAPAPAIDGEVFDALGTMAERLAKRASIKQSKPVADVVAAHLEVANFYGVKFTTVEREGNATLCYDGEAFRRVLALSSDADQRARAALAVTRHDCVDPAMRPNERLSLDQWRSEILDRIDDTQMAQLSAQTKNRLHVRRAGVWASVAYQLARREKPSAAAAQRAIDAVAAVNKTELSDDDFAAYTEAAVRANVSRWAAVEPSAPNPRLSVITQAGRAGETCVLLVDGRRDATQPLAQRCTYGIVWTASANPNRSGNALTLAVQTLDTWRELWVFRKVDHAWTLDVLPPSAQGPDIGYIEFAGWVPDGKQVLFAREARENGRYRRSFEVTQLASLSVDKRASEPNVLLAFAKWQDPAWKAQSLSVR